MYVAHPVSGDIEGNRQSILRILQEHHTDDVLPLAPYLTLLEYLDDSNSMERKRGIEANTEHFTRGMFDEVGVFGQRVSLGMFCEIELAMNLGIPIRAYNSQAGVDLVYAQRGLEQRIIRPKNIRAERKLSGGDTLFFIQSLFGNSDDIVVEKTKTVFDEQTGRDVTRFVGVTDSYDEMLDSWEEFRTFLDRVPTMERDIAFNNIFDRLADFYGSKSMGWVQRKHTFEDLAA